MMHLSQMALRELRNLRKARFGSHTIERRRRGPGTYEYRLAVQQ